MDSRFVIPGVDAATPLSVAGPALLLAKADPLFALEAAAASGADMDAVHDMRVASRRLRETMRLLEPLFPRKEFSAWYRRVRSVTRALGPVRDSDVFIDACAALAGSLGGGGRRAVAFAAGHRLAEREVELVALNKALSRLDLVENRRSLKRLSADVTHDEQNSRSLSQFAHAEVASRAAIVFGALPIALMEENVEEQHALRIDFKRLRYAVEVFAVVYGGDFDALHRTLTSFQDELGDLHDLHLFSDIFAAPEFAERSARGGVSAKDVAEVVEELNSRADATFRAFVRLAAEHPASELLGELLLPLAVASAPAPVAAPPAPREEPQATEGEPAAETETATEPEPPPTATPVAPAVVLQPAAPVAGSAPMLVDPTAEPWRSDAAGLSIDPPIVIGAEPWARPAPAPRADTAARPETALGSDTTPSPIAAAPDEEAAQVIPIRPAGELPRENDE